MSGNPSGNPSGHDVAALQSDIERTREELAETVDALAAKLDVKARLRDRATTADGRPEPALLVAGGVAVALVVVLLVVRRRRR